MLQFPVSFIVSCVCARVENDESYAGKNESPELRWARDAREVTREKNLDKGEAGSWRKRNLLLVAPFHGFLIPVTDVIQGVL